jgi:hypothetical protein
MTENGHLLSNRLKKWAISVEYNHHTLIYPFKIFYVLKMYKMGNICEIWGFHVSEDSGHLLGCDAV